MPLLIPDRGVHPVDRADVCTWPGCGAVTDGHPAYCPLHVAENERRRQLLRGHFTTRELRLLASSDACGTSGDFGRRIQDRLNELGRTIVEAAKRARLHRTTIRGCIDGTRNIQGRTVPLLARGLDLPVETIQEWRER